MRKTFLVLQKLDPWTNTRDIEELARFPKKRHVDAKMGEKTNSVSIHDDSPTQYKGTHKVFWEIKFWCSERQIHGIRKIDEFVWFLEELVNAEMWAEKCVYMW